MNIPCVWEHNGSDTLLYAVQHPGAYARGESLEAAIAKMPQEITSYLQWCGQPVSGPFQVVLVGETDSELTIRDADSDVLFEAEAEPLTKAEYDGLKALALRSAKGFLDLYASVPDSNAALRPARKTFYGFVPHTATEMYEHTKNVNAYYFGEIDVEADNDGDILSCRRRGFEALEKMPGFLENPVVEGSYGERWSLRKVLRRFLWHDRIHARAMYRTAVKQFGKEAIANLFYF